VSELSYAQSEDRSQATKLPTQAEDRDRDRFKSRFKEHPVPKVRCRNYLAHHRDADVTQRRRHSVLCTGAPTSLPRELHSSDLHMRSRGVPERAHRRTSPLPRACSVNPGLCCSFMKSTRLRLDPQGYIAGDAGVTQRSAHKRSLQCSTTLCPCETEREHEMAA